MTPQNLPLFRWDFVTLEKIQKVEIFLLEKNVLLNGIITGDGEVNAHSRIQMMLFKAHQKVRAEFELALSETDLDEKTFYDGIQSSRRWWHPFSRPAHHSAGIATNLVYTVGKSGKHTVVKDQS